MRGIIIAILFILMFGKAGCQTWQPVFPAFDIPIVTYSDYENKLVIAGGCEEERLLTWDGQFLDTIPFGDIVPPDAILEHEGKLLIGGAWGNLFQIPGTRGFAVWDDDSWGTLGNSDFSSRVYAMALYRNELYVGGRFTKVGSVNAMKIAKWDGFEWSEVDDGIEPGPASIRTMAVYNDELYVGGNFSFIGDTMASCIARWNGSKWLPVGNGFGGRVQFLLVDSTNNLLYATGDFSGTSEYSRCIAVWNGSEWDSLGLGIPHTGTSIAIYQDTLYASNLSEANSPTDTMLSKWNGSEWEPILGFNGNVNDLKVYQGNLLVGGSFTESPAGSQTPYRACYGFNCPVDVSIKELKEAEIDVWPLVTNDVLNYKITEQALNLYIYDTQGKVIYNKEPIENSGQVTVNHLPNGVYILSVITSKTILNKKFVVQY